MPDCETFRTMKRAGATKRIECPNIKTCDGTTCVLPAVAKAVATLSPEINTSEDNAQVKALAEAEKLH